MFCEQIVRVAANYQISHDHRWEGVLLIKSGVIHSGRLLHPETGLSSPTNSVCLQASFLACISSLYHDHFRLLVLLATLFCENFIWRWSLQCCSLLLNTNQVRGKETRSSLIGSVGGLFRQTIWRFIPCCAVQLLRWDG
ncbi:hypothetical protein BDL97_02G130500 [Sphagnum fallax]|nr:hypothetical protein BDL97_02G130500 [Sphagnum fallax]